MSNDDFNFFHGLIYLDLDPYISPRFGPTVAASGASQEPPISSITAPTAPTAPTKARPQPRPVQPSSTSSKAAITYKGKRKAILFSDDEEPPVEKEEPPPTRSTRSKTKLDNPTAPPTQEPAKKARIAANEAANLFDDEDLQEDMVIDPPPKPGPLPKDQLIEKMKAQVYRLAVVRVSVLTILYMIYTDLH